MLLLAACATPEAPLTLPERTSPQITLIPTPRPVLKTPVLTRWTLDSTDDHCTAAASGAGGGLRLVVNRSGTSLSVQSREAARVRRGSAVPLKFTGPAGSWTTQGAVSGRTVGATSPMDEEAAGRALVLLSGGVLRAGTLPPLAIPAAGARGSKWFECVRRQLLP